MQRLNLVPPDREPASNPSPLFPQPNPAAVKEIERRADFIVKSGKIPDSIFICGVENGILTFRPAEGKKPLMLMFMTPYAAADYIRATKAVAEVRQLTFDSLPKAAESWMASGVESFILNRCPRCNVATLLSMAAMKEKDTLFRIWAIRRATQLFQGEIKVHEYMRQSTPFPVKRAILELIRDHIDCGVPYLYELIAFHARIDGDETAKADALERLKEFGPQFADWESRWDQSAGASSPWIKSLTVANLGLGMNFGIEYKAPPAKP